MTVHEADPARAAVSVDSDLDASHVATESPSWVNRFIALVDRLPVPAWLTYVALTGVAILVSNAQSWASGTLEPGEFSVAFTYYGILLVAPVWLIAYLDRAARASWRSFRPALAVEEERVSRLREELTVIPARPAAILTIIGFALTAGTYAADPAGSRITDLSAAGLALRFVAEGLVGALILVLLYHTVRQMRAVDRIHAAAARIDLLRPAPLYAFSRLTARTAIGIVLLIYSSVIADPGAWSAINLALILPWLVVPTLVAAGAFVLPLKGMHERIVAEKERLQSACAVRIESVTASIHHAIDDDDLTRADGLNKMLASLVFERELLAHLPTWPWKPGTAGAFATAILLPVGLFIVTRFIDRLV